jgi:hypothetical protein
MLDGGEWTTSLLAASPSAKLCSVPMGLGGKRAPLSSLDDVEEKKSFASVWRYMPLRYLCRSEPNHCTDSTILAALEAELSAADCDATDKFWVWK